MTKIIVHILFSSWKQYTTSSIESTSRSYQSNHTLTFKSFLDSFESSSSKSDKIFDRIGNMKSPCFTVFASVVTFQLFWLPYCSIITWISQLLILYSSPPEKTVSFRPTWRTLSFQGSERPTKALVLTYNSYFVTMCLWYIYATHKKDLPSKISLFRSL